MMTSHIWGDDWEHWSELYAAESYICKFYYKCTKKYPHTKEKYGTIRYEFPSLWITTDQEYRIFCQILKRAVVKYPNVGAELLFSFQVESNIPYDQGWMAGFAYAKCQSEWASSSKGDLKSSGFAKFLKGG